MAKIIVVRLKLADKAAHLIQRGLNGKQIDTIDEALSNICVSIDADTGKILEYHQDEHWNYN